MHVYVWDEMRWEKQIDHLHYISSLTLSVLHTALLSNLSLYKIDLYQILSSHPLQIYSLFPTFLSIPSPPPFHPLFTKDGEVLKGAGSSTHTWMEGGFRQLLAAKEADKENQTLENSQANPPRWRRVWSLHFWFSSLPCQEYHPQALRFPRSQ